MKKAEKTAYLQAKTAAYYSGFGGIEIKEILYGYDDSVVFVAGAWCSDEIGGRKTVHRSRIRYTLTNSEPYFIFGGCRIHLSECIRCGWGC